MNSVVANLQASVYQMSQLLVLINTVIQNPTPANVDAAVTAIHNGSWAGLYQWKINYSLDGESYSWQQGRDGLIKAIKDTNEMISTLSMPWVSYSRARP